MKAFSISALLILTANSLFSQNDNTLYIGGTGNALFTSNKPITNSPWDSAINRYSLSLRPEIGLASADMSSFYGFGLGFSTSKGMNFNTDERFIGMLVGGFYRKAFLQKMSLAPFVEGGLDATIGQSKIQQSSSDYFGGNIYMRLGLMYDPNNKWLFFLGMNVFSMQYDRYTGSQVFRVGFHNAGAINISVIRVLKK